MTAWEFWIDVGGTFTDCIARTPEGRLAAYKVLSSGVTKGRVQAAVDAQTFSDPSQTTATGERELPPSFFDGYEATLLDSDGNVLQQSRVSRFSADAGAFTLADPLADGVAMGAAYELRSGEPAPVLAVRTALGLRLDEPIPPISVKLGTTRGTNALLTRRGARTAFVTTRGFADVLLIGNQDRPRLFDLAIVKPSPLFDTVLEVDERIDVAGSVLRAPDPDALRADFQRLKQTGIESVAICLLHSFANPEHELLVERIARDVGFTEISTSSRLAPLIKIVSRGDTTVMDAYLNPILRAYVASLRSSFAAPGSSLRLMTSVGGLVDADRFVGKDSILSGPAGGVVGFSRVAQRAGFDRAIGFDMGGTSTDVARFDGGYEREFETQKAGVRVVAPMLAIETVAAGGGSVCDFDGVKLHVGPQSAGADPGPACYGRGGPLTVTDVNLYLGKIVAARFPFPLDRAAVERRLETLCEQIAASPLGKRYTPRELAAGFVEIANANMVRAIRRISVAKGYDPQDYVLVTFGGAGAQHACAMSRSLGVRRVLIHPFAGILSAYGIGLADVHRFAERAVLEPYRDAEQLEPLFAELEEQARGEVLAEGVFEEQLAPPVRSLEMRYQGAESTIQVTPGDEDYAARFEQLHEQHYGYRHGGRPIEVTAARVEVVGRIPAPAESSATPAPRTPTPAEAQPAWFDGKEYDAEVYLREQLHPGDRLSGPAIVCEPTSTVVIDPGFAGEVTARGEILITDAAADENLPQARSVSTDSADPVLLEIFSNLFASIAEQMGVTLQRTSFSTNVKERLDFSCAIFDPAGELVVNAPHIPVHLGAMSETVKRIVADNPDLAAGDVFVTNDPYRGGSHLPDVTVITPVFDQTVRTRLLFFTASRAHHAEIGGVVPGSMPPFSKNLAEEGVLIRNFRLVRGGESREAELKELLESGPYPSRSVGDNLADVRAQVAANQSGVRQLQQLVERYSLAVVQAYMQFIQQAAAAKMRMALAALPDGSYTKTDHLDEGAPIAVRIEIRGETATVDFSGTGPVLATNLNANRAIVTAAVLYVFRCLINEEIPLNGGVLEPVEIVLPECLLNPPERSDPRRCAAVVGGNVETSQRVVDALLGALGAAAASQGTMNNLTFGNDKFGYYETICGGAGATPAADGADAVHTHMTNTRLTDPEVIERRYPVRVREFSIRRGSGGAGRHRGGDGIIRRTEFLEPLKLSILSERRGPYPPFGLEGGADGAPGRNTLRRAGADNDEDLGGKCAIDVAPGEVLTIETPGGGGFGEQA